MDFDKMGRIIHGDCIDEMQKYKRDTIDLIISDYPFNIQDDRNDYVSFVGTTAEEYERLLKDNGNLVVINNPHNIFKTTKFFENFVLRNGVALVKKNDNNSFGSAYHFNMAHNYCYILSMSEKGIREKWNGTKEMYDDFETDVFEYTNSYRKGDKFHPQAIPEWLVKKFVKYLSDEGDLVLDPFLGSGTTAKVCEDLNRDYIGIEINEDYVEMAKDRVKYGFEKIDNYM